MNVLLVGRQADVHDLCGVATVIMRTAEKTRKALRNRATTASNSWRPVRPTRMRAVMTAMAWAMFVQRWRVAAVRTSEPVSLAARAT